MPPAHAAPAIASSRRSQLKSRDKEVGGTRDSRDVSSSEDGAKLKTTAAAEVLQTAVDCCTLRDLADGRRSCERPATYRRQTQPPS
ncbi:hypothetical protein C0Q70_05965 [Pomacea canaliculata]|uniref:Uncharacterized protein n=1 Tax=Pomacea canaliculata TaxID=400727 RepID=A0A2T7PMM5_POMCA|nr:hypothetical protein C0Q70_05965 [Pomacea canaliculata]